MRETKSINRYWWFIIKVNNSKEPYGMMKRE